MELSILASNTILYCQHWEETVEFYQNTLGLKINYSSPWLIEFTLTGSARVSLANQTATSVKSAGGQGITLTWQVANLDKVWYELREKGVKTGEITVYQGHSRLFRFYDPEGHRLEIWSINGKIT